MTKNLIYTVAINHDTSQFKNTDYSQYCLMSWEKWCKKRNIDFLVIDTHETNFKYPHWDKYTIFNHIDNEYEKIGLVDSDTMVHWEAPNPFDLYNDEWCWVKDLSNLRWTSKSIENYNRFYPEEKLDIYDYYNSGVCFFTKEHKIIFDNLIKLYKMNKQSLDEMATWGGGKDQTLLNYELKKQKTKVKELSSQWNMFSMHKKEMFNHNWQDGNDKTPFFIKYSWIWHFTGFPIEQRTDIMKQTWDLVGKNYE